MRAAMPKHANEILRTVRELARKGLAAELDGKQTALAFVDIYRQAKGCVAHVVYYGEEPHDGFQLRVGDWLASGRATLHSPQLKSPVQLTPSSDRWITLAADFGQYAVVQFG
jgi:hypothetical protein